MVWAVAWHDTRDNHDHMRTFSNKDVADAEAERIKVSGHSTWVIVTTYDPVPAPRTSGENDARARRQRRLARTRRHQ